MTPIPVGTLCLLLEPHELAGCTCTTTSPLKWHEGARCARTDRPMPCAGYEIEVRVAAPQDGIWIAKPHELRPLTPPPGTDVGDVDVPVPKRLTLADIRRIREVLRKAATETA